MPERQILGYIEIAPVATNRLMVSNCANPKCSKPFLRLDGGKVFGFRISHSTEHFWLCGQCAKLYTLRRKDGEVTLASRKHAA